VREFANIILATPAAIIAGVATLTQVLIDLVASVLMIIGLVIVAFTMIAVTQVYDGTMKLVKRRKN